MTRFWFQKHLKLIITQAGLPAGNFSCHSFRIGAATTAAQKGLYQIQTLGRWSSDAFKSYIRYNQLHIREAHLALISSSCAARSVADGAPTSGAAEPLAPFGCIGSPSSDASNRALHQAKKGDSPLRCSRAAAPFGRSESPSISRVSLLPQHWTGLPFRCSRPTAPFGRSVTPPSVIPSCAARSVADGAPTPGAAEPLAPFGCNGSPSSDASNRALH